MPARVRAGLVAGARTVASSRRKVEPQPAAGARRREPAAQRLGERAADRQAQPQAAGAAAEVVVALLERVEDPRQDRRVDADPGVLELDGETLGAIRRPDRRRRCRPRLIVRIVSRPPDGVNLAALRIRFQTTCMIRAWSAIT